METFNDWLESRRITIVRIRELADEMNDHGKNAKIASAVGNGVSLASGVASAICFFAIPVTFGASAIAGFALAGVSGAGAATSIGSSAVNHFLEKGLISDVQKVVDADRKVTKTLQEILQKVQTAEKKGAASIVSLSFKACKNSPSVLTGTAKIGGLILKNSDEAVSILTKLGKGARLAGAITTFVVLPLDLAFFIKDAVDLADGNVSKAAKAIHEFADTLQFEYNLVKECITK